MTNTEKIIARLINERVITGEEAIELINGIKNNSSITDVPSPLPNTTPYTPLNITPWPEQPYTITCSNSK